MEIAGARYVKRASGLFIALVLPIWCAAASVAGQKDVPYQPGETLTYQLKWEFIPVGTAVLQVLPTETMDGAPVNHFLVNVATNDVMDAVYKVRDRIDAYANGGMTQSVLFKKKQREGKTKRDVTVTFDWQNLTARYSNAGKTRDPIAIRVGTFDPVSLFYAFRLHDLKENTVMEAPITDGKSLVIGKARIHGKEWVEIGLGRYETLLVEPDIKDAGGVFENSQDAKLRVWLTDDIHRIPVKVACRAPVGHFIAELVSVGKH
jgi:hypothetical protein